MTNDALEFALFGNKKPTEFSEAEKLILRGALADRIRRAADGIH